MHLAADLESDDEKEDRHQPVVDPEMQRLLSDERSDANGQRRVPE
jgi:hypothetical protein